MENKELFREIGLTTNEGKVYSELVKHGKLPASEVSSKSQVPYGKIYVILQRLIDKGLVQIIPDKTKKFVASSPETLIELIDEKKKNLDEAKKKVSELKQFYDKKDKDFLIIGEGEKGFWKIEEQMTKGKDHSYRIKLNSAMTAKGLSGLKKDLKKNLDIRELVRINEHTEKNVKKLLKVNSNTRKFSNKGIALAITEKEVFLGLVNKNTTLLIRDEALADVLSRMYLATYEKAEKII